MLGSGFSAILEKLFFLLYTAENTLGRTVLHSRQTIPLKYREECLTDHSSISFQLVDFTRIAFNCVAW
jgi:hypothetical protein